MKCSKSSSCPFPCDSKIPEKFQSYIDVGICKVMDANSLPDSIGDKITASLMDNLDAALFCNRVTEYFDNISPQRERILDRLIVHQFEEYYAQVISILSVRKNKSRQFGDIFDVIPRGKCLDLFLSLIKEHCMGAEQIKLFSQKVDVLTQSFANEKGIDWQRLYASQEYKACMTEVFSIIFRHFVDRPVPIPALTLKLDNKHQAQRINKLLSYMGKLWLNQHIDYSI